MGSAHGPGHLGKASEEGLDGLDGREPLGSLELRPVPPAGVSATRRCRLVPASLLSRPVSSSYSSSLPEDDYYDDNAKHPPPTEKALYRPLPLRPLSPPAPDYLPDRGDPALLYSSLPRKPRRSLSLSPPPAYTVAVTVNITPRASPHTTTAMASSSSPSSTSPLLPIGLVTFLLAVDAAVTLGLVSSMVVFLHGYGSGPFPVAGPDGQAFFLSGKPANLVVNQAHTANAAGGTALVLIGFGGVFGIWFERRSMKKVRLLLPSPSPRFEE